MKSVRVKLREYLTHASNTEREIIQFILKSPEDVSVMSVRELARVTFTSPSTVTRFCKKTGFNDYKDFQRSLMYENAMRKEAITDKNSEIKKDDSIEQLVNKIIYKSIVSLEETKSLIDLEILDGSVSVIQKAKRVAFFGMGASLLVAKDACLKFMRVNKVCIVNEDFHAQLVQAKNMTNEDAAIIISYSGMTREMVECAEILKDVGVPIIAITCYHESPLSKISDYNLYVTATEFEFRTGKLGSRLSQLAVIDMLYVTYVQENYETCMDSLRRTYISKEEKTNHEGEIRWQI
ncbi:MurR/RpiR family transcriptional regulator [Blautia liquoris]|jgi:DNA-binding MurR/RpiR family transcriptional regulator|uniref:MurR/RpiR family transcriptional regulator n=1 Tax=Blautia liquoris TaxID=2779518 RepID=A0A7M2RIG5_9FIRM|nr:MurR/RpiR family transcriptional regulator [Blautia liquoris]QOV19918.1 MurR/RpiR family transcriptional regulator [Blautia liquoris]